MFLIIYGLPTRLSLIYNTESDARRTEHYWGDDLGDAEPRFEEIIDIQGSKQISKEERKIG